MSDPDGLAFYPITFPMIVGPGTIATLIIYAGHVQGAVGLMTVGAAAVSILAVRCFTANISKRVGARLRVIMTRLTGMILLAIAVEMMVSGVKAVLLGLAG